jgi:hypothetical protein
MKNKHTGSTLRSLFAELGETRDLDRATRKKLVAEQLRLAMERNEVTPSELAHRMGTSRAVVYRLLNPSLGVTLAVLDKATEALGYDLRISLVPKKKTHPLRACG